MSRQGQFDLFDSLRGVGQSLPNIFFPKVWICREDLSIGMTRSYKTCDRTHGDTHATDAGRTTHYFRIAVIRQRCTKQSQEWRAIAHVRPSRLFVATRDITGCVEPSLVVRARRATPVASMPQSQPQTGVR